MLKLILTGLVEKAFFVEKMWTEILSFRRGGEVAFEDPAQLRPAEVAREGGGERRAEEGGQRSAGFLFGDRRFIQSLRRGKPDREHAERRYPQQFLKTCPSSFVF